MLFYYCCSRDDENPIDEHLDKKCRLLIMNFWITEEGSGKKFANGNIDLYCHYKNIQTWRKWFPYHKQSKGQFLIC